MEKLILQPNSTAQWYTLINEAQWVCELELGEDLESYLVFLLIRYMDKPGFAKSILAIEFLDAMQMVGRMQQEQLQGVGDKCLLYSGLYPEQAKRKRVKESYFIDLGQNAYYALAGLSKHAAAELYQNLCDRFIPMHQVLKSMRGVGYIDTSYKL